MNNYIEEYEKNMDKKRNRNITISVLLMIILPVCALYFLGNEGLGAIVAIVSNLAGFCLLAKTYIFDSTFSLEKQLPTLSKISLVVYVMMLVGSGYKFFHGADSSEFVSLLVSSFICLVFVFWAYDRSKSRNAKAEN